MRAAALAGLVLGACATPLEDARPFRPPGEDARPSRPLATFSIVARDQESGELGVAVQSHWFSVGAVVPWAEAGVGAVATQSFVNPAYGPEGLALMEQGKNAPDALRELLAQDPGEAVRQVAFVDAKGRVGAHTGKNCIASAGHLLGEGYSVQANMMENERVVPAMARAFELGQGPFAGRLLAALEAAQREGGDIRGQQSAALLVVRKSPTGKVWEDRRIDLRVEDHPRPIEELRRLLAVHEAYEHMNAGDLALEQGDLPRALAEYARAAELQPESVEIRFWNAFTLATNGKTAEALPIFGEVFAAEPSWIELLERLPASELCSEELVRMILEQSGAASKR